MTAFDCAVIGAGPAGLSAAIELRRLGRGVVVLDRDEEAGGIPRHSSHTGYGLRDLHRVLTGPAYARRLTQRASDAGADIRPSTTVTSVEPGGVWVTAPGGREFISAQSIVLATGCRERPRSALMVPGDRPAGVLTTGALQRLVHLQHARTGNRAVVVGAGHVSCSAVLTLVHAGCSVAALVSPHAQHATWPGALQALSLRHRFDVRLGTDLVRINGRHRVESVDVAPVDGGSAVRIPCDTVVFTGDWVPDHELARRLGLGLSPGWRGPSVDASGRTSAPGVFAAGNLLHGALTADLCALEGRRVAGSVHRWIEAGAASSTFEVPVVPGRSVAWVHPTLVSHPAELVVEAADTAGHRRRVEVQQDGRLLYRSSAVRFVPGRPVRLDGRWSAAPACGAGPLAVGII